MAAVLSVAMLGIHGGFSGPAYAGGGANRETCPVSTETSPGFRPYLPDCRAYEMVTPPFIAGFPPSLAVTLPRPTEFNSQSLLFNSFGVFADAPNSVPSSTIFGTLYQADRDDDGWRTHSPMPPVRFNTSFPGSNARAGVIPSADNSSLVWRMHDTAEAGARGSIYLGRSDGSFDLIGPVTDEPGPTPQAIELAPVLGEYAAPDLGRIPLRAKLTLAGGNKWLWPGDTTLVINNNETLYEYDLNEPGIGTPAAEPKLVGVKNENRLGSNAEADLISQCGTVLGGGGNLTSGRLDRSISNDGKYLYFTAQKKNGCIGTQPKSSEIYARIGGEESAAISNPSAVDCSLCLTGAAKEAAESAVVPANLQAIFQGASTDGTKVFFTSFQELFAGVSGAAGAPNLYRFDFEAPAGEKLELVSEPPSGFTSAEVFPLPVRYTGFSADGERAYFVAKKVLAANESAAFDPVSEENQVAEENQFNLYVWDAPKAGSTAQVKFIAQLPAGGVNPIATPDGRFIVFSSTARLVESNASTAAQLFEYDALSGALVRISVGDQGFNDNGNTSVSPAEAPLVSDDGRRVFFMSSKALTPGSFEDPTNAFRSIYEWTWSGEAPSEAGARVFSILGAPAENGVAGGLFASLRAIDPTGNNVYFSTLAKLVPQHAHGQPALYTARVEGGFPSPEEASCAGGECQSLPSAAPEANAVVSATLLGPGNANQRKRARRRCQKGARKVRKAGWKARCAPKQSKRNRRQTKTKRRAGR